MEFPIKEEVSEIDMEEVMLEDYGAEEEEEEEEEAVAYDYQHLETKIEEEDAASHEVILAKLPRPVDQLNCRMSRSYLVKLLREANNGKNPAYGNPAKKPPFWPDFYWPWEKMTDIHSRPAEMKEPLQYSEMMKLALENGYKYYGYDPYTYVDAMVDLSVNQSRYVTQPKAPTEDNTDEDILVPQKMQSFTGAASVSLPVLPRAVSKLNSAEIRSMLSKLLRYEQDGNNPVYGSPDTKPPWWPEEKILWCDMVDLRGKPTYFKDQKLFNEALREAVFKAVKFYGIGSQTDSIDFPTSSKGSDTRQEDAIPSTSKSLLPQKLPAPVSRMGCSQIRTFLSKLLWFYNDRNPPQYGMAHSKPIWWPNDVMEWTKVKNLHNKFGGTLKTSFTNSLRAVLAEGYKYYGLNADTYFSAPIDIDTEVLYRQNFGLEEEEKSFESPKKSKSSMPPLRRIVSPEFHPSAATNVIPQPCDVKNNDKDTISSKGEPIEASNEPFKEITGLEDLKVPLNVQKSLKKCMVDLFPHSIVPDGYTRIKSMNYNTALDLFLEDRSLKHFVDLRFVSGDGVFFWVHKFVVAAQSKEIRKLLTIGSESQAIYFADIKSQDMELLVDALYKGEIFVPRKRWSEFMRSLDTFQNYGFLRRLYRKLGPKKSFIANPSKDGGENKRLRRLKAKRKISSDYVFF